MPFIAAVVIDGIIRWLIHTGLIWGLIKIQKLEYKWLGLLGATAMATMASYIPTVGFLVSHVLLMMCLWKAADQAAFVDIAFTVCVASVLMTCVRLFAIGVIMGPLRPDLREAVQSLEARETVPDRRQALDPFQKMDQPHPPLPPATSAPPEQVPIPGPCELVLPDGLSLKGISMHAGQPLAMLGLGSRVHTVTTGETVRAQLLQGLTQVRCDEINRTSIVITIDATQRVRLFRR